MTVLKEPKYKWELAVAGLIHDIGKFYQKSTEDKINKVKVYRQAIEHTLIAEEFIKAHMDIFKQAFTLDEIDFITECAVRHHSNASYTPDRALPDKAKPEFRKYCNIICQADNLSSSERSETYVAGSGKSKKENATLEPPFVRLGGESKDSLSRVVTLDKVYKLAKWSEQSFKISDIGRYHTASNMTNFVKAFDAEVNTINADSKSELFSKLNNLIKEYTWCIPSDSKEIIRDVSLYQHLITTSAIAVAMYNDLRGMSLDEYGDKTDNFTFTSVMTKGEKEFDFLICHLNLVGAEDFVFNTKKFGLDVLDDIYLNTILLNKEVNKLMLNLITNCDITPASCVVQSGYERFILIGQAQLEEVKQTIYNANKHLLELYNGELYFSYKISDSTLNQHESAAPLFSKESEHWNNGLAEQMQTNGEWDLSKLILTTSGDNTCEKCGRPFNDECDYCESSKDILEELDETFKEFKHYLRKNSNKIGFIVVDADKVLEKMRNGFITDDIDHGTISRVATYSNIIANFFGDYLREQLGENVYLININSNKVIIACDMTNAVETTKDIIDMFNQYTLGKMTLSSSIYIFKVNERVNNLVYKSNTSLYMIKKIGGNRIYYKNKVYTIDELDRYLELKDLVYEFFESKRDKAIIRKIAKYSNMYKRYMQDGDILGLECIPLYTYNKNTAAKAFGDELFKIINDAFDSIFKNPKDLNSDLIMLESIVHDVEQSFR